MRVSTSGQLQVGGKVAVVRRDDLHRSLVRVIGQGLIDGIPGVPLDGHHGFADLPGHLVVKSRQARLAHLRAEIQESAQRSTRARRLASNTDDETVQADFLADAERYSKDVRRLEAEAAELVERVDSDALPMTFDSDVQVLLAGLNALLSDDGSAEQAVAVALRAVLDDFRVSIDGDEARWSTKLLVPFDAKVAVLGPFTGTVRRHGRELSPAEVDALPESATRALQNRAMTNALIKAGYARKTAEAAVQAPGGYLPRALLGQKVIWPDCPPDYDHEEFNGHVRSYWPTDLCWANKIYNQTSIRRQEFTDLVAALGGEARVEQITAVCDQLEILRTNVHPFTLPRVSEYPGIPPWLPSVLRIGTWRRGSAYVNGMASISCPRCSEPATAVVRVPEVPDALLCRNCLVCPSLPGIVFPPMYGRLALPPSHIPDHVIELAKSTPRAPLSRRVREEVRRKQVSEEAHPQSSDRDVRLPRAA